MKVESGRVRVRVLTGQGKGRKGEDKSDGKGRRVEG